MGRNQPVVAHDNLWAVKGSGAVKATRVFNTQHDAIIAARKMAKNQEAELIVHGEDRRNGLKILMGMIRSHQRDKSRCPLILR